VKGTVKQTVVCLFTCNMASDAYVSCYFRIRVKEFLTLTLSHPIPSSKVIFGRIMYVVKTRLAWYKYINEKKEKRRKKNVMSIKGHF